jgi:hypothetical protein
VVEEEEPAGQVSSGSSQLDLPDYTKQEEVIKYIRDREMGKKLSSQVSHAIPYLYG